MVRAYRSDRPLRRLSPARRRAGISLTLVGLAAGLLPADVAVAAPVPRGAVFPAVAAGQVPHLLWRGCGQGFQCATARVPLDYRHLTGRSISLALIRLPAADRRHRIGSLFVNPGGPGGSGVDFVRQAAKVVPPAVRARFDVVGFDPRGVAHSTPLQCFASAGAEQRVLGKLPPFPVGQGQVRSYIITIARANAACARRAPELIRFMSTADVARDLDLLRRAVGDPKLTYAGYSYGTYLGATYVNLFPRNVRAVIVDGVLDPVAWATGRNQTGRAIPFSTRLHSADGAYATLLKFFATCDAAGRRCAFSAGDPQRKYAALTARLLRKPLVVPTPQGRRTITYADVVSLTLGALYSPQAWPALAGYLQQVYDALGLGGYTSLTAPQPPTAAAAARPPYPNGYDSFAAVACDDTINPRDPYAWARAARAQDQQAPYFGAAWTWASAPCATWPAKAPNRYLGPFTARTSAPVLIVGNRYDPATRYQGAQTLARLLPRSRLITLNGYGHTSLGQSACISRYQSAYLLTGALPAPGTVCQPDTQPFYPQPQVTSAAPTLPGRPYTSG